MAIKKSAPLEKDSRFAHLAELSPEQIAGITRAANAHSLERSWDTAMRKYAPAAQTSSRRTSSEQ